ncbi:hypothetical protein DAERI_010057 [Deinococcus aerius]|uniref:Uncharacterized protein n=1 Tax=Deinococcus aerius TaxID=200253 RepID=A0A2I9DU94_9DEIO|nr:hypothetical protein [Deinococcus aerius]GBF03885.1 hypothetical protein DAERI_010057 [Deinococcus aerius]
MQMQKSVLDTSWGDRLKLDEHRGRRMEWSGFFLVTSEAEFDDLDGQIDDTIAFLKRYAAELAPLADFPGVDVCELDFGIEDRDVAHQADAFPAELLRLAGNLNIGLVVSRYPQLEGSCSTPGQ